MNEFIDTYGIWLWFVFMIVCLRLVGFIDDKQTK